PATTRRSPGRLAHKPRKLSGCLWHLRALIPGTLPCPCEERAIHAHQDRTHLGWQVRPPQQARRAVACRPAVSQPSRSSTNFPYQSTPTRPDFLLLTWRPLSQAGNIAEIFQWHGVAGIEDTRDQAKGGEPENVENARRAGLPGGDHQRPHQPHDDAGRVVAGP